MSVYNLWDKDIKEPKFKISPSSDWDFNSTIVTPRSPSPPASRVGEAIFNNYLELIQSKSNISTDAKQTEEPLERPFDFYDDEEFAFGINLLNKNVACVGDNITKLIQMAQEPWPENVKLFQPYEVEQILLPDNASCLAVQAFLKMCNLPFEVEMRWNAEYMSPSGRVPFIQCGAFVVSELEPIVQFAANKGASLCSQLAAEDKAEMRAYMSLITNVLVNAELYISWVDSETYNSVTRTRNSSVYPWPLGWLQTRAKRNAVIKRLKALHWYDKTLDQVLADVEQCCDSLSQRLGEKDYFFGTPTPLDALLYGHMRALLSATGPKAALGIKPITSALLRLVLRVAQLTNMKLTTQEEYLVTQAFQVSRRRRLSPERYPRSRRSKMSMRNPSRDSLAYGRDMFGFKPFACKQIIVMASKGAMSCERRNNINSISEENTTFVLGIIEDVLDKVEEYAFTEKLSQNKNDFEVIAIANEYVDSKYGSIDFKADELFDTTESIDDAIDDEPESALEDILHVITDDDGEEMDYFSDGNTNDSTEIVDLNDVMGRSVLMKNLSTDSSNNNAIREDHKAVPNCGDGEMKHPTSVGDRTPTNDLSPNSKSVKSSSSTKSSRFSSESKVTLKIPSDQDISVTSLLRYLRRRNAAYGMYTVLPDDVD